MTDSPPRPWLEAARRAQECVSAGDVQGLTQAVAEGRRQRVVALTALMERGRIPPPAASSAGERIVRRVALRKAERRRRQARMAQRRARAIAPPPAELGPDEVKRRLKLVERRRSLRASGPFESDRETDRPGLPEREQGRPGLSGLNLVGAACLPGLNGAKIGEQGPDSGLPTMDDLQSLGVAVLRHPGITSMDLSFGALLGEPLPPADEIYDRMAAQHEKYERFLKRMLERGMQVVLTIGAQGTYRVNTDDDRFDSSTDGLVFQPIRASWSDSSKGYLDIRPYVAPIHYLWLIQYTEAVCRFLKGLESSIAVSEPGFALADVVYGLELFNEIDMANTVLGSPHEFGEGSWKATAQDWASLLVVMAKVLAENFPNGAMRILLPGLSSWDLSEDDLDQHDQKYRLTWAWKINFFRELVASFAMKAGQDLPKMAHGVDHHWYHRRREVAGGKVGPLHISRLTWELEQLYSALADAGMDIDVTMFETGMSVLVNDNDNTYDYWPEAMADREGTRAIQLYQGQEVSRRFGGAAAGGATVAGWHTWRSNLDAGGEWYGLGLRRDVDPTAFEAARPRASWLAYQRYWTLLASWRSASMILPQAVFRPVSRGTAGISFIESPTVLDGMVIEYRNVRSGLESYAYAYLVFLDKWRGTDSSAMYCVPTGIRTVHVTRQRMLPAGFAWQEEVPEDELPAAVDVLYVPPRNVDIDSGGFTWKFKIGSDPILLLADGRLSWSYVA